MSLDLPGGESLIASVSGGGFLMAQGDTDPNVRLDFSLDYEDVSDDPQRHDRLLASLSLTKSLPAGAELTAGLVYSNKPEFLSQQDIDENLSARLGLKLKVTKPES